MSESKKLHHNPKTLAAFKELRKVDQFMFGGEHIKSALDQAFEIGSIGLFALDCVVSEPVATEEGIGKIPFTHRSEIEAYSGLLYQKEPITHVTNELIWAGLQVGWWAFIGDDDFAHSVSPEFSVDRGEVAAAIVGQIDVVKQIVEIMSEQFFQPPVFQSKRGTIAVRGWLEEERSNQLIQHDRSFIAGHLTKALETGFLPQTVAKRLGQMRGWRTNIVNASGLPPVGMEALISAQAVEEMASFMVQGLRAPDVIHQDKPDMPLIFANTFPDLGTHQLDDACLRFPSLIGLEEKNYGTIHLPGASRLAHAFDKSKKVEPGKMFTCGDPKGNPNY